MTLLTSVFHNFVTFVNLIGHTIANCKAIEHKDIPSIVDKNGVVENMVKGSVPVQSENTY